MGMGASSMRLNRTDARCLGVCAGIADYYSRDIWLVRIVALTLLIFIGSWVFIAYLIGWVFLKDNPDISRKEKQVKNRFENLKHSFVRPGAVDDIAKRFERMEKKLRRLEAHVTSPEFKLRRKFDNL